VVSTLPGRRYVSLALQVSAPDHLEGQQRGRRAGGHRSAEWLRADPSQSSLLSAGGHPLSSEARRWAPWVLEQAGDQLLELRDRRLIHLFNLTLLATRACRGHRLRRCDLDQPAPSDVCRLAADTAVTNDGRIRLDMPESGHADEIGGAVARNSKGYWPGSTNILNIENAGREVVA